MAGLDLAKLSRSPSNVLGEDEKDHLRSRGPGSAQEFCANAKTESVSQAWKVEKTTKECSRVEQDKLLPHCA